jgi:CBS domain-containing protein
MLHALSLAESYTSATSPAPPCRSRAVKRTGLTGGTATIDVREIREVMSSAPETVDVGTPIRDAADMMRRSDIGNVIVVENDLIRPDQGDHHRP